MIEPNFNLLLWIILIIYCIGGGANIINGILGLEKPSNYGTIDIATGLILLLVVFAVSIV